MNNIFKPKSKEEISSLLSNHKIASYNLQSYFKLSDRIVKEDFIKICNFLKVNPYDMEISHLSGKYYALFHEYFLDNKVKDIFSYYSSTPFKNRYGGIQFNNFEYSTKLKIIHWIDNPFYFAYPSDNFKNIVSYLYNKYSNILNF